MKKLYRLLTLFALLGVLTPLAVAQKHLAPLPIEDVAKAMKFTSGVPVDLSPDGQWVAYTLQDPRRFEPINAEQDSLFSLTGVLNEITGSDIWLTNTKTTESKNLTEGKGTSWSPVWSPDGRRLAFYSNRGGQANLWVWEKSTGQMRQVSDVIVRPLEVARWTPDSRKILCKVLPEGMTLQETDTRLTSTSNKPKTSKREHEPNVFVLFSPVTPQFADTTALQKASIEEPAWMNRYLADLAMVDISSGRVQRIVRCVKPLWYAISPDGTNVAFVDVKGVVTNSQQPVFDLVVYSMSTSHARVVAPNLKENFGISVSWSPDGKLLSYTTVGPQSKGDVYIVRVDDGVPQNITVAPHPNFGSASRAPLWDPTGLSLYFVVSNTVWRVSISNGVSSQIATIPNRNIVEVVAPGGEGGRFWSRDGGRSILVITRDDETKQVGFYKVDLVTGTFSKLLEESKDYSASAPAIFYIDVSADGQNVVYVAQDAQRCPDLWIADSDFQDTRQLTHMNSQFDRYKMGVTRLIEWRSIDGQKLHGTLILPSGYEEGKSYPLIVWVYGGNFGSNYKNRFSFISGYNAFNVQVLPTRGYAVLYPDAPLRKGTPVKDLTNTVMPGVNRVIELGIADPDRLGVMGQSYGGYSTLALITQTPRFKAAVMSAGSSVDLMSAYGRMDKDGTASSIGYFEEGQGGMGGTPWQYRETYIENSPVYYLDQVITPLMIVRGTMDGSSSQLDGIFVGLRRLGKEAQYVQYEGEGHVIRGYANVIDFWNRRITWLDKHLSTQRRDVGMRKY